MASIDRPSVQRVQPAQSPYLVANRAMRWLLSSPRRTARVGEHLPLFRLATRTTRRRIEVPVAFCKAPDGKLRVLTSSVWRVNLRGRPEVGVNLHGQQVGALAERVEDPDSVAQTYDTLTIGQGRTTARRRMGIRVDVDRSPTHEELADAVRRHGLSPTYLQVAQEKL